MLSYDYIHACKRILVFHDKYVEGIFPEGVCEPEGETLQKLHDNDPEGAYYWAILKNSQCGEINSDEEIGIVYFEEDDFIAVNLWVHKGYKSILEKYIELVNNCPESTKFYEEDEIYLIDKASMLKRLDEYLKEE